MNNREWLNNLASTDVSGLNAWMDAEHADNNPLTDSLMRGVVEHLGSEPGNGSQVGSEVGSEVDIREKLEADVYRAADEMDRFYCGEKFIDTRKIIDWLDRQAAITRAECDKPNWEYCETCELTRKLDNLAQDLAESERLREEMREELSIAYDHAHDLLARRDRGLA